MPLRHRPAPSSPITQEYYLTDVVTTIERLVNENRKLTQQLRATAAKEHVVSGAENNRATEELRGVRKELQEARAGLERERKELQEARADLESERKELQEARAELVRERRKVVGWVLVVVVLLFGWGLYWVEEWGLV